MINQCVFTKIINILSSDLIIFTLVLVQCDTAKEHKSFGALERRIDRTWTCWSEDKLPVLISPHSYLNAPTTWSANGESDGVIRVDDMNVALRRCHQPAWD